MTDYETIQEPLRNTEFCEISEKNLEGLWMEFSEIQHATFLRIESESLSRFKAWLKSGNNDDAWS